MVKYTHMTKPFYLVKINMQLCILFVRQSKLQCKQMLLHTYIQCHALLMACLQCMLNAYSQHTQYTANVNRQSHTLSARVTFVVSILTSQWLSQTVLVFVYAIHGFCAKVKRQHYIIIKVLLYFRMRWTTL